MDTEAPTRRRGAARRGGAAVACALLGAISIHASPALGGDIKDALIGRVPDRPEIRSFQPYSGLQYGFRPEPPARRDGRERRRVIMPKPVAPLIEPGAPGPGRGQYYVYCPRLGSCP
jgi:hypothetical protein